jgi:O-antigen ligase
MNQNQTPCLESPQTEGPPFISRFLDRVLVPGLCVLLIFAVLAFGAVEDWSIFLFEVGAAVLGLIWMGKQLACGQFQILKNPLYLPACLFFIVVLAQIAFGVSAYPYVTKYAALQYVSYGVVLWIASNCIRGREQRKVFALIMIVFGASYALFALTQDLTSNAKLFWLRTPRFSGSIFGSYVNRNHYAGLMEMLAPIPLAVSFSRLLPGVQRVLVGFCGILMASTIFLCGSRGGMIAFTLEIVLLGALLLSSQRRAPAMLAYAAVCISVLVFIFLSNNGRGLARIGDLSPGIRPQIMRDGVTMFSKKPVWGWGLDTFPTVYPQYRSFYTNLFINEAHNDYVQLLVETGVIGCALMVWFLIGVYRQGLAALRHWRNHWDRTVSLAALIGCTGIMIHSFVDFNLHITANAAFFYALCALSASELQASDSRLRLRQSTWREVPGKAAKTLAPI